VVGSIVKSGTRAGSAVYASSKVAIEVLANTLAQELGSEGVTVNTIHPGMLMSFPKKHNLAQIPVASTIPFVLYDE
jgi:NAD(P)-dependent dehydrogenase (short-subunit alcohol dehydrogenase family)